uniref:TraB family protein n=1 Tax=Proboscia inermis TaxID=420281 RepID=A0A7S0CDZ2_9STRA|mmetsp:Transcript_42466/g.43030  ORF Transcript_42466/g.43030 Transcript_42466/m.43030 type:complete len:399 (+) Transcript_42466:126-1322(+)
MTNSIVSRRGVLWLAFTCIHLERTVTNGYTIHSSPAVGRQTQRMSFALSASRSDDKVSTTPTQQRSSKFPDHIDMQRREWMQRTAGIVAGSVSTLSTCANAATTDTTAPTTTITPKTMKGLALCDSNVSTFTKNGRTVHLLGTAHISSVSAQLAGRVVRETSPDAVFVELDAKRVDRVFLPESEANQQLVSNAPTAVQSNTKKSPFGFIETIKKAPAALVGKTISNMYKKLESDGLNAGEEFSVAVNEGLKLNAAIVLGDRDVDVTLQRLTTAISKTNFKQLLSADSQIEEQMINTLPTETIDTFQKIGSLSSDEMRTMVEILKTNDNVKALMANLKRAAPEIYGAMVAERDEYMARGLNELPNKYLTTVAVMGLAHIDGVERNLMASGWTQAIPMCT